MRFVLAGLLILVRPAFAVDIVVVNNADGGNGTLRQAIQFNESLGGGSTIVFSNTVIGTINLTNALGELLITKDVTIVGPGAKVLAISGNNSHRVFRVTSNAAVSISGLTITGGRVTLGTDYGAGISQESGILSVSDCIITGNNNLQNAGGGISAFGTTVLSRCTVSGNAGYDGGGGGILAAGTVTAINCTIVSNITSTFGAGIRQLSGNLFLTNCTISRNRLGIWAAGISVDGGIAAVRNTIIASNTANQYPDCYGTFTSGGFNLIGAINGSSGWGALGDQVGSTNSYLNPVLGPLLDNGGSTPTMAPQTGSPVIDQGHRSSIFTDQRGRPRPYTNSFIVSIPLGGDRSDIGAVEVGPATLVVTTTNDAGPGSLRQTILDASPIETDTIIFAPNVTNTITLTSGPLNVNKSIEIYGPDANVLTVSGNKANRVFNLSGGSTIVYGLTIANGWGGNTYGGGVLVDEGDYIIVSCQIVSNAVTGFGAGGGICVRANSDLDLYNSSVIHNVAGLNGGGIALVEPGTLDIYNSTIASNRTTHIYDGSPPFPHGGGISVVLTGSVLVASSTIASNVSTFVAGGIGNGVFTSGTVEIRNSIIAGNTAVNASPDVLGPFNSGGYNLIGNTSGGTGFTNTGDQLNVNPLLGPLANYGGATLTMALRSGSPALDKGKSFGYPTDQRGLPRPLDDSSITNASGGDGTDIGAFEVDPRFRIVDLRRVGSDVALSMMTVLGRNYRAEYTNDLASGDWMSFTNNVPGSGYLLWVTNSGGANEPRRFYRGAVVP